MSSWLTRPVRLPRLRPYVPADDDPPIFWFNGERENIIEEVVRRLVAEHGDDRARLELALNEVAYHETRRLEAQRDDEARQELGYWRGLLRRVTRMSTEAKREALEGISRRLARDIAGNFDPRVYGMATAVAPKLLTGVMSPASLPGELSPFFSGTGRLDKILRTSGDVALLRRLQKIGTLVYVPTHSSNLDSIALGYGLYREGLSPVVYGAGKNLFSNPIISFFMHNLGAYRVDRRVQARLYKNCLKTYSAVMIERGYHSLFFPGGTRSRSGMVERHLKLGLAGSAVGAFARNRVYGIDRPLYFVPCTINYGLVMEAESLIEDHLQRRGRERFFVEDDEFSQVERWVAFFRKLVNTEAACVIHFGRPVDPFSNPVDDEGHSLGPSGRVIDPGTYVLRNGEPTVDPARDAAYTQELGETLLDRFRRLTVVMSEQLVAHVLFRRLVRETPGVDLFSRLRFRGDIRMPERELREDLGATRDRLLALAEQGAVHVERSLGRGSPDAIFAAAKHTWVGYHTRPVVQRRGADIVLEDPTLLLFYQNRLVDHALDLAGEEDRAAAREIAQMGNAS
jgi:glycerol-3-phosphate O-acyltransferase